MSLMSLFRPLTPREMIRWAVRLYFQYFPQWLVLGLLAVAPLVLINLALAAILPQPSFDPAALEQIMGSLESGQMPGDAALLQSTMDNLLQNSLLMLQQVVVQLFIQIVVLGVIGGGIGALMASAAYQGGAVSLAAALGRIGSRLRALGAGHLLAGLVLIAMLVGSILGAMFCVGVLGLGLTIYTYLAWVPLLAPALALEDGTLSGRLRRAWSFGKQRIWLIFAMTLALYALRFLLSVPLDFLAILLAPDSLVLAQIMTMVVEVLVLPLGVIYFTILYHDLRGRQEQIALELAGEERPVAEPILSAADLPGVFGVSMTALALLFALYMFLMLRAAPLIVP